jgi:high-affinity iron transporter
VSPDVLDRTAGPASGASTHTELAETEQIVSHLSSRRRRHAGLVVVGLAVLREGSEVVLFLYGIFAQGTSGLSLLTGGALGILAGVAFTGLTYAGLLAIPQRYIFSVTSWLIALLAAGMAAQSAQFLYNAGVVDALGDTVWDTSWLLTEQSLFGQLMHTLVGYVAQPTALQLAAYIATLIAMFLLMRIARHRPQARPVEA